MKIFLVYNPVAGSGKGKIIGETLVDLLNKKDFEIDIHKTLGRDDLMSSIKEKASGVDRVFVCGGDGTFRDTIEAMQMIGWPCPIGLFPAGSGNDFAKTLGIESSTEDLLETYIQAKELNVYSAKCNENSFINVFGVGIDTDILLRRLSLKRYLGGSLCYLVSSLISIFVYKPKEYKLTIDGTVHTGRYYIVTACNGKFFGGGMKIGPKADLEDKKFHILALKKVGKLKLIKAFKNIYAGKHLELDYVESYTGNNLKIEFSDIDEPINIDGDIIRDGKVYVRKSVNKDVRLLSPNR